MSATLQKLCKRVSELITKYKVKKIHDLYFNDSITYGDYKEQIFKVINNLRRNLDVPMFSEERFDEAWQYRTMAHENWRIARSEIINVVLGWW